MSKNKNTLEPTVILSLCTTNNINIPLVVTDAEGNLLALDNVSKICKNDYYICKQLISKINKFKEQFNIDTILMEQNKMFIDTISKYPDPYIMRNVLLGFKIATTIENNYYESVKYILNIPEYDWTNKVLSIKNRYSIDFFKSHIKNLICDSDLLQKIEQDNYYKVLCFSESVLFPSLMNKKYQVNKENETGEEI